MDVPCKWLFYDSETCFSSGIFLFSHLEPVNQDKMKKRMVVKDDKGTLVMVYIDPSAATNISKAATFFEGTVRTYLFVK